MNAIYVEITATRGSAPRNAGTVMQVTANGTTGTIGGGALEFQAIASARQMLTQNESERTQTIPLGPGLGQCCGGSVSLLFTRQIRIVDQPQFIAPLQIETDAAIRLWVWGAGHVGRAVINQAASLCAFDITWIDSSAERFPEHVPQGVTPLPIAEMVRGVRLAPKDAHHLILTYSHDIDLALCSALLGHGFAGCGLIGSATKKSRFARRLRAIGLDPERLTCPIGDKTLGKHPDQIAAGTIRALTRQKEIA